MTPVSSTTDPVAYDDEPRYTPRQREILAAATKVFAEHGYRAGTIALVAAEAGLSQPGLIHHFPNKDAILMAVIELREREDLAVLLPAFASGAMVIDAFVSVLQKNAQHPELMQLFAVLSTEALHPSHPAHSFFVARYRRLIDAVTDGILANQRAGLMRADLDPLDTAKLIVAAADGLRYQSLLSDGPIEHWKQLIPLRNLLAGPNATEPPTLDPSAVAPTADTGFASDSAVDGR